MPPHKGGLTVTIDKRLEELSPEVRAQFEKLKQYYERFTIRPVHTGATRTSRSGRKAKRPKQVRYSVPPSWEDYTPKRHIWQSEMWPRVIQASMELLAEVGPRGFTVKEVAKRAGVARSTIYKYIGIKAELLTLCKDFFWRGGWANKERATERIAYYQTLEALAADEERGGEGPLIADLMAAYVFAAARSQERQLWLLATAEGVRSLRPPRYGHKRHPNPLRDELQQCLWTLLEGAREPGTGRRSPALTDHAMATIVYAVSAITWYEATLNGPIGDDRWGRDPNGPIMSGTPPPRLRGDSPEERRAQAATCRQAITWLLRGAGLGDQRLTPLPPLSPGRLPAALRQGHPTGKALHDLQLSAHYFDLDDMELLLPHSTPQSPLFRTPPRLPVGRASA